MRKDYGTIVPDVRKRSEYFRRLALIFPNRSERCGSIALIVRNVSEGCGRVRKWRRLRVVGLSIHGVFIVSVKAQKFQLVIHSSTFWPGVNHAILSV